MMKKLLSNGLVIAGMLGVPAAVTNTELPDAKAEYRHDPRLIMLKDFFRAISAPAQDFPEEFLRAADRHKLDWRLLPSLSVFGLLWLHLCYVRVFQSGRFSFASSSACARRRVSSSSVGCGECVARAPTSRR